MSAPLSDHQNIDFLAGGGEMGERIRSIDWSQTLLGRIEDWPPSLRTSVSTCLGCAFPIVIWWGPELTILYNDEYRSILGPGKHPMALGKPGQEVWSEIWNVIGPMLSQVKERGQATRSRDLMLSIDRGYPEEAYFSFSYSPIRDEGGNVRGVFCPVIETTEKIIGERRLRTLRDLAAACQGAESESSVFAGAARVLRANPYDVPFAMMYRIDGTPPMGWLDVAIGIEIGEDASPLRAICSDDDEGLWSISAVQRTGKPVVMTDLSKQFTHLPCGAWKVSPHSAMVLPVLLPGQVRPRAVLIAAVNPMRALDDAYRTFFGLVASQVATGLADARALEEQRRRAESLAALDEAKTHFFSNVSHEFRTPLTLMLGPVEDLLDRDDAEWSPAAKGQLEIVHRNALRLLKLVNTMLDFSRIEAGRMRAQYEETDLASYTAELASNFRSACERAGIGLTINCPTAPPDADRAYVDRDMWDKIVLNLLSNAFKFTFEGEIEVSLETDELELGAEIAEAAIGSPSERPALGPQSSALRRNVTLRVRDTGIGIAAEQLPHIFERFHRVEESGGRTHEGTGIGLALVRELAKLHGGTVGVESELGRGSTFTVSIPLGKAHLDLEHVRQTGEVAPTRTGADTFVEEAMRWLPEDVRAEALGVSGGMSQELQFDNIALRLLSDASRESRPRILWVDDNADMRAYVARLLSERFEVVTATDGETALEHAESMQRAGRPPDLVLTDVMLPRLDGFGLLRKLRADTRLGSIPIILLSARAGEEARIEGVEAGADDYLIKPFSAKELLAKVQAHLDMSRMRRDSELRMREDLEAMTHLYHVGDRCARAGDDERGCLEAIVDAAIAIMGTDKGNLQRFNARTGTLTIAAQRGFDEPFLTFFQKVRRGEASACGTAMQSGQRVIVEDVTQSPIFASQPSREVLLDAGVRAVQSVPLISSRGTLLGMISTHCSRAYRPGERELRLMDLLARQAADYLERRQGEQCLQESEERFRAFTSGTNDVIYRMGPDWTEMRHLQGREFIVDTLKPSRTWLDQYIAPDDQPHVWATIQRAIEAKSVFELEHRVIRVDGSLGWTSSRAIPILDDRGDIIEWFGAARDVTKRKQLERALQEAQAQLEYWNAELTQKVALKTAELIQSQAQLRALTSELTLTEQRERKRLATDLHDHLQQMLVYGKLTIGQGKRAVQGHSECKAVLNRVDGILSDALTYSRTLVAELSPPVLHDHGLVAGLKWLAKHMKEMHGLTVKVVVPDDQWVMLPDDQCLLLFQAARELLNNSAKHACTGEASLLLEQREGSFCITVSDEGKGFDLAAMSMVRADTPESKVLQKFGLFNIRERMWAMGGGFSIQSAIGRGTVATLSVPLEKLRVGSGQGQGADRSEQCKVDSGEKRTGLTTDHSSLSTHQQRPRIRVLLVDDHAMVRQGLRSVLDAYTDVHVVGEAGDGEEAMLLVERLRPAVVVMDINMPKMNGIKATEQIKKQYPQTLVIGVSVNAAGENQEAMVRAGATRLMTKEAAVEELYAAIQDVIR